MSSNYDTIIWIMLFFVFIIIIGLYISESTPLNLNQKEKILMENFTSTSTSSDQSEGASQFFNWGLPDDDINYNSPKKDNVKCDDDDDKNISKSSDSKCTPSPPALPQLPHPTFWLRDRRQLGVFQSLAYQRTTAWRTPRHPPPREPRIY